MSMQPRSGSSPRGGTGRHAQGGMLLLWGVAVTLLVGSLTVAGLVVVGGGPQAASAAGVVVDTPTVAELDEADAGAEAPVVTGEAVAVAPAGWTSVLAADAGFYRVVDYSLVEISGHLKPAGGRMVARNDMFDVVLGDELVAADLVYSVEVADQPAEGDLEAAWTVTMEFADAQALADATADLGCHEKPDNMIAIAAGEDLLILASLEADSYCGSGFTKGRIRWQSFYDNGTETSESAKAIADAVAAGLLGTQG